jgi:DNA invertase Pin-like site-specific DNA recombinase
MTRRVRARNRVCRLDELHARVERLEQSRSFGYRDHVAQRRRVVVELRSSGLSIAAIAKQFGLAASTVERDLQQTPHEPPSHVRGLDGKRQPTRKGAARNGRAPA